ncbi:MAG: stage V sporulation protein SpoVM [Oscillospiraceae bacterium]|nr:stage V sporulation protein SpoVM [Oscillospiraceae bacterium]
MPDAEYTVVSPQSGGIYMKIVVVRSPKLLSGVFRLLFGIRKTDEE